MTAWAQKQEQLGGEVVAQLKAEIAEWRDAYERVWHRRAGELDQVHRLIAEHLATEDPELRRLVGALCKLVAEEPGRPRLLSPHEMRTRHLQQRAET